MLLLVSQENQKKAVTWPDLLENLSVSANVVRLGGGLKATERQHAKGRFTARERIAKLQDAGTDFLELMLYAGFEMYGEAGGCPSGGVVTGLAKISGRDWMIVANDATVKAGAFFPITAKKVIRAQSIAMQNHLPVAYLVDSAGVYLPMQDEIFPDQDDFGRVFFLNARMSAKGIPQIAAIMGNCVAGGAYLPAMCDTIIMTEGSGLFLAGPALVKAAIGQVVDTETLGGAKMHAGVSGIADFKEPTDDAALTRIRELASLYGEPQLASWAKRRQVTLPPLLQKGLNEIVSADGAKPYEILELVHALVDANETGNSSFQEYKADYGQTIVTGFARLGGFPVAIVANQRSIIKKKIADQTSIEVGGVIYAEAADKAARFILDANQMNVPLLFLSDVTGFMVGLDSEQNGIIRRGAKMVNAVSNSRVPKITVITGGSFGAGNYAMAGKAFAPNFIFAWPSAKYAVMSGNAAAKTLLDIQLAQMERQGHKPNDTELQELYDQIKNKYDSELDPRYAAARLWVDEIILPSETRSILIRSLELCSQNPEQQDLKVGVFQV